MTVVYDMPIAVFFLIYFWTCLQIYKLEQKVIELEKQLKAVTNYEFNFHSNSC